MKLINWGKKCKYKSCNATHFPNLNELIQIYTYGEDDFADW